MPPPLHGDDGLLRRTGLPEQPDPYYKDVKVDDIPDCGPDDTLKYRLVFGKNASGSYVDYPAVESLNPLFRGTAVDDALLQLGLTSAGGYLYDRRATTQDGSEVSLGTGVLHLCEVAPKAEGDPNAVYISDNAVLNNRPSQPVALRPVMFEFRPEEVMAIVHGLRTEGGAAFRIPGDHYQVDPANHSQLRLMPNLKTLEAVIEGVRREDSLIRPERREAMAKALEEFVDLEIRQSDAMKIPPWLLTVLGVLGGALAGAAFTAPIMIWMQKRNERLMKEISGGMSKVDPKSFTKDATQEAKSEKYSSLVGQERVLDTMMKYTLQPDLPHVIFTGPPGSGKSATMQEFFHQIATDRIPHLKGKRLLILEAGKLSAAGAVYAGLSDKALEAFIEEAKREPSVVWVKEAHQLISVGLHSGNQSSGALDKLKATMEDPNSGITFILDSDRSLELMKDEAIARRTQVVTNEPPRYSDVLRVVEGYAGKYGREHNLKFESDSLKAITLLADYKAGAAPSCHKLLMGNLVADAKLRNSGTITLNDVVRVVSYESRRSEATVRGLLEERTRNPQLAETAWAEPYVRHARENGVMSSVLGEGEVSDFEKFLDSIGLNEAERRNLSPGELGKAIILRLSATGGHQSALRQELVLLDRFLDRVPNLVPDRDELVRRIVTARSAEAVSKDREARPMSEMMAEYAREKNIEEKSRDTLLEAARRIDTNLEKKRKEEKERRERERK